MKKTIIAALVVIILWLAAYFSRSYWMPVVVPSEEGMMDTWLVETGMLEVWTWTQDAGWVFDVEITEDIQQELSYKIWEYLNIPTVWLRIPLPEWRTYNISNDQSIKIDTSYKDTEGWIVSINFFIRASNSNQFCKSIPDAWDDCSGVGPQSKFLWAYDTEKRFANNNYVFWIGCGPWYCLHLIVNWKFNKPYYIGYGITGSPCPFDPNTDACYWWEPTIKREQWQPWLEDVLWNAEEVK